MAAIVPPGETFAGRLAAVLALALFLGACVSPPPHPASERPDKGVVVYSASPRGNAFAVAGEICRAVTERTGRWCENRPGRGTKANLEALRSGRGDFAVASADLLQRALASAAPAEPAYPGFPALPAEGADPSAAETVRYVLSLYPLAVTVLARPGGAMETPEDLLKKRIGLSGRAAGTLFRGLMAAAGWRETDFAAMQTFRRTDFIPALCAGAFDVGVMVAAHPNHTTATAVAKGCAEVVPLRGPVVDAFVSGLPYLAPATIPGGFYGPDHAPVRTFGIPVVLVSSTKVPDDVVFEFAAAVFARAAQVRPPGGADAEPVTIPERAPAAMAAGTPEEEARPELIEESDEAAPEELAEELGEAVSEQLIEEPDEMESEELAEEPDETASGELTEEPDETESEELTKEPGETVSADRVEPPAAAPPTAPAQGSHDVLRRLLGDLVPGDGGGRRRDAIPACPASIPRDISRELLGAFFPVPGETQCGKAVLATAPGPRGMASNGRVAPVHPGAARLFEEIGLTE